ncbi:MAG: GNAT family N-acetyltransferase [Nostocaceae cyanobacterium]|nr:GNAT family N-acetyltransferase [Nostocaceae cyanobacterium]
MKLRHFDNTSQFYSQVKDYLHNDEAENCLPLGISESLINNPQRYNCQPYLASVEVGGDIVAVAIQTPPYNLVLSKVKDMKAIQLIAQNLSTRNQKLPGFCGLTAESLTFAQEWQTLTGEAYQMGMQLRIHQLQAVEPIPKSSGFLRTAREADRELLIQWYEDFEIEAMGGKKGDTQRAVDSHLRQNTAYIWEDELPVTIVFCAGSTSNSKRLGPVYTPPRYRKQGYATTCVAQLSQKLLDEGNQFCCLFTDLANPTSNKIYRKIGYQPIADWNDYILVQSHSMVH